MPALQSFRSGVFVTPLNRRQFAISATKPTIEMALQLPVEYAAYTNDALVIMAASDDYEAKTEVLIRNIMAVDNVTWEDAHPRMREMESLAQAGLGMTFLPHKLGAGIAGV